MADAAMSILQSAETVGWNGVVTSNIEGYLAFIKALLDRDDDDDLVVCDAPNRGADGTFPFPLTQTKIRYIFRGQRE